VTQPTLAAGVANADKEHCTAAPTESPTDATTPAPVTDTFTAGSYDFAILDIPTEYNCPASTGPAAKVPCGGKTFVGAEYEKLCAAKGMLPLCDDARFCDRTRSIVIGDTNRQFSTYDLRHNAANFPGLDWANNMDKFDKDGICYWADNDNWSICSWIDRSDSRWSEAGTDGSCSADCVTSGVQTCDRQSIVCAVKHS